MDTYRTLKTQTVFQGSVFDVTEAQVVLPNGHTVTRHTVVHPGAVVILPQAADRSLLLVEQYRHALRSHLLEFPAGTMEQGEEPEACARREIVEEVGQAATEWKSLGVLYPAPGICDEVQHLFFATGLSPEYAAADDDEIIEIKRMSVSDVEEAIVSGALSDAKSVALFSRARLAGLL
ncbi:MAG: NUDIX hydrolase [Bdellovibrionales bacterium]|nr:NUDIX hydrolase [Bdellovibrionales bacterium]